ncbi:MAG: glycoside hydrolase family 13 protein [Chloroflexota bacterium]
MTVPYWVQDAIFYQIFPDRFANGDASNDPPNVQPWGAKPTTWGFQGGDLRGIIQHFDYLLDVGINAIYLNPIFQATSNHRYNISDYYKIDPKLGELRDFRALLEVAHQNNVHVILDGVFNHCGRGFFAFNDLMENQEHSAYKDWFHVNGFPVDGYSPGNADDYLAWWDFKSLPKFRTDNPEVRSYLMDIARYWIEQGADGWRLDVPNEIDDDSFWAEFRHVVKSVNRDAYLMGEIWKAEPRWVGEGHFDGLMNYPVRDAVISFLTDSSVNAEGFAKQVEDLLKLYPRENAYAMYVLLGSHDTERIRTMLKDVNKVKFAFAFLFAYPGAPAVYYGDEVGLEGGKDPDCRRAFPWDRKQWDEGLWRYVRELMALRKRLPVLRRGDYTRLYVDNRNRCYAFARTLGKEALLVALNASAVERHLHLPVDGVGWVDGRIVRNVLGHEEYIVTGDKLHVSVPSYGALWVA